ncbi:probable RNA-binding protein 19 [Oncorhynchus keta]|uniref:probable RNA-binding protein 19 n=1 Tax=Oncorhynchus keta TaxID=8018 RepID=UPI00227AE9A1|nr:probable RNA-binding protein 19 [Oncorhynchus keta]
MGFEKELEGDEAFQEFVLVHHNRSQLPTWANDSLLQSAAPETGQSGEEEERRGTAEDEDDDEEDEPAPMQQTDSAYESGDRDGIQRAKAPVPSLDKSQGKLSKPVKQQEVGQMPNLTEFTVKLRECPFNVKEQQVREFMTTLKPAAIRIIKNATGNKTEYMYVDLRSEEEVKKSLKKNKDYMGCSILRCFGQV